MERREFVASLEPDLRARLTKRSDAAGLRHLGLHGGAIGLVGLGVAVVVGFSAGPGG